MSSDNVRRIDTAATAKARASAEAHHIEQWAQRIAAELKRSGAVVLDCADETERDQARRAGRKAGRLLGRSVRTKVLPDERVAIWEPRRSDNPLQARLDEQRATKILDQAYKERGPLLDEKPPPPDGVR